MYCTNCGCENNDTAFYCIKCNKRFKSIQESDDFMHFVVFGVAVALILTLYILINVGRAVNLNKYVTVTGNDINSAHVTMNWDALDSKYSQKLKYTTNASKMYKAKKSGAPSIVFKEAVKVSIDTEKTDFSSNKIYLTWDINNDYIHKFLKCKVKCNNRYKS